MSIDTILTMENKSLHCRRIGFPGLFLEQVALEKIQFIVSGCDYRVRVCDQTTDEPITRMSSQPGCHRGRLYDTPMSPLTVAVTKNFRPNSTAEGIA